MRKEIIENHKKYVERVNLYRQYGYGPLEARHSILKHVLPLKGKILEVGTGRGYMTLALAEAGYSITSIDNSKENQKAALLNAKYYNIEDRINFKIDDACNLSFKDNSFDMLVCTFLMHHLKEPDKAVDEFLRVVKPGGQIVLSEYNKEGLNIVNEIYSQEGKVHHATVVGLSGIADYLKGKDVNFNKIDDKYHEVLIIKPKDGDSNEV